jgi:RES domain-containing protein
LTPLPSPFNADEFVAWRLDREEFASSWDSGEGAYRGGGRWNNPGVRAVYCSIDPSTAILEVAVHKGFEALDTIPHVLTSLTVSDTSDIHVIDPAAVPNPNWLRPGHHGAGQQSFGDDLLGRHKFVVLPSTVSTHSWNLVFLGTGAAAAYALRSQERFALDTRLHPPARS